MAENPKPVRPATLPALAEDTLSALSQEPVASRIILGGGIALKHYSDFRMTHDVDAWWRGEPDPESLDQMADALDRVAESHGLAVSHRRSSQTDSFEFHPENSRRKEFSFQIAVRDVELDAPIASSWPPIAIETLRDNIGAKMNALVKRGAPRDFVDIYRIVQNGLMTADGCWALFQEKNPGVSLEVARAEAITYLTRIELNRPLWKFTDSAEREAAAELREWFRTVFLSP